MADPEGPRLPADTGIGRVRLQVADLERSLAFYRDVIGFRVLDRRDGVARLGPGSSADADGSATADANAERGGSSGPPGAVLLELVEKPGVRPVPQTGLLGIYHFALLLPGREDLGRFVRHQTRRGTRFGAADHAFSEAVYLEDPDGITLEVYADRPRDAWPGRQAGNLPLVSDPLDAAGLMAAAAGSREWDGVPPGAGVGHMHFFVDDLDAAAAFYVHGLGFEPMISVPTALFVSAGGYHHHVGLNTWRAGARAATDDDAKLLDWELRLPDGAAVEGVARRLEAKGFDVAPPAVDDADHAEPREHAIVARDPWGIRVKVAG